MATDTICLWTIQHPLAWEKLKKTGILRGDGRRSTREFRAAYVWMRQQAQLRIPGATGRTPVWFWQEKPDLRHANWFIKGEKAVCLGCRIPRDRVLLSDFYTWHHVLNWCPVTLTEEEWRAWETSLVPEVSKNPDVLERMQKTWERIFDIQALTASSWQGKVHIQAVAEELRLCDVVSVRIFTAR